MIFIKVRKFLFLLFKMSLFFGAPFLVLGIMVLMVQGWSFFLTKFDTLIFLVLGVVFAITIERYRYIKF